MSFLLKKAILFQDMSVDKLEAKKMRKSGKIRFGFDWFRQERPSVSGDIEKPESDRTASMKTQWDEDREHLYDREYSHGFYWRKQPAC
ncbi:hypothetical protein DXT97_24925 [Agrobacterium tumefaciens]|nr:hypothetical protein [Agrobacterium tumefaciens]OVE93430.1 hypothetical protein B7W89_00310 [Agrobacterium tumefaciens]